MANNQLPAPPLVDAVASVGSLRTLGTGAQQAAAGNDSRFGGGIPSSRTISAGAGLTGGGDLSANRTISVDYSYSGTWTSLETFSVGLAVVAGYGITWGDGPVLASNGVGTLQVQNNSSLQLMGSSQLMTYNGVPALMRLGQKMNNEVVWSINVDQNNSDALDDNTDSAWKFSMQTYAAGAGYDGLHVQYSAVGAGSWMGNTLFTLDATGTLTLSGGLNVNNDWALVSSNTSGFLSAPSIGISDTGGGTNICFNGTNCNIGNAAGSDGTSNVALNGVVTINTVQIDPNATVPTSGQVLAFNGTEFVPTTLSAGGITGVGAVGSSPNADAASVSGSTLTLQPADASHPGVVNATTQSFGGTKTFSAVTVTGTLDATTIDDATLNYGATTATTINIGNASSTNTLLGNTTVQGPFTSFNGAFLLEGNSASTIETLSTASLTISAIGSGNVLLGNSGSGNVNIGQGASISNINVGPSSSTIPITLNGTVTLPSTTRFGTSSNIQWATVATGNTQHFIQCTTPSTAGSTGDTILINSASGANGTGTTQGGTGGGPALTAGNGGTSAGAITGGFGGQVSINGGNGGSGGTSGAGGNGGGFNFIPGAGGNGGSSGNAGVGGDAGQVKIFAQTGGTGLGTSNGGTGSLILAFSGTGGTANGTGTGGSGGGCNFTGGNGGVSNAGNGGTGGGVFFTAGNGGASSTSGTAGGNGGGINIQGGTGGTSPNGGYAGNGGFSQIIGSNGAPSASGSNFAGAGGQLNISAGNAGTAVGSGNSGGNLVLTSGNGTGVYGPGTVTLDTGTNASGNSVLIGTTTCNNLTLGRSGIPLNNNAINQCPNPGTTLTAAGTISLTNHIEALAGATTITSINLPSAASSSSSSVYYLCVTAAGTVTFGIGGNLALVAPVTVLAGTLVTAVWEAQTAKWYIKG